MPDTQTFSKATPGRTGGATSGANDWAIVVGIKDYGDPDLNTLKAPITDAEKFLAWLRSPTGGGIVEPEVEDASAAARDTDEQMNLSPDRVKIVKSKGAQPSLSGSKPTLMDVSEKVEEIEDWLMANKTQGRRLYLYMAGHGCTPIDPTVTDNVALLMANAQIPKRSHHNFPATSCARSMRVRGLFKEVILIMDCCRSKQAGAASPQFYTVKGNTTKGGTLVEAYATNWDSVAHEFSFPPGPELRGVFTRGLLACLTSGRLTGSQLRESVQAHVLNDLKVNKIPEDELMHKVPMFRSDPDGGLSKILFSEDAPPSRTEVRILKKAGMPDPEMYDMRSRRPGQSKPIMPDRVPNDPERRSYWRWLLEPGSYAFLVGDNVDKDLDVHASLPLEVRPDEEYAAVVMNSADGPDN